MSMNANFYMCIYVGMHVCLKIDICVYMYVCESVCVYVECMCVAYVYICDDVINWTFRHVCLW
jgi:hypothetical protein